MCHLAPICCLLILMVTLSCHYVYAAWDARPEPTIVLFNPVNGQHIDVNALQLRSNDAEQISIVSDKIVSLPTMGTPCSCQDFSCKCCLGIGFGPFKQSLCVLIKYNPAEFNVRFNVDFNQQPVTSFGLSVQNIPDFCVPLMLPIPIFICLRLTDIRYVDVERSLHLCVSLVMKLFFQQLFEYRFNCLRLNLQGVSVVRSPYRLGMLDKLMPQPTNDKLQIGTPNMR